MLKKALRTSVENLDLLIGAAGGEAGAIRVELDARDHTCMVHELMHDCLCAEVPQSDAAIVTARGDHTGVEGKLRGSHPIRMALEGLTELALVHVPDLDELVICTGD